MKRFITKSESSQQILKSAKLASTLPVNTLISGEVGVGKKLLAAEILPSSTAIEANELEKLLINNQFDLSAYKTLIVYDLHNVINIEEFLQNLKNIKLVITSQNSHNKFSSFFPIKINILPLKQRKEDLEELKNIYIKEATNIYNLSKKLSLGDIKIDLSKNGYTLKQSIYKSVLLQSITTNEMMNLLQKYLNEQLQDAKTYKELIAIFEIPILKAAKNLFKSQLKMAEKLSINRITLRKKLDMYSKELE